MHVLPKTLILLLLFQTTALAQESRPNIIFIMVDEHDHFRIG
jgi:hypothetical protein